MHYTYAATLCGFLIPALASLASLLGASAAVLSRGLGRDGVARMMGFASGVMLSLAFAELLPQAIQGMSRALSHWGGAAAAVLLALGLGISYAVESRADIHDGGSINMLSAGLMTSAAMVLHNLPEGMAGFAIGSGAPGLRLGYAVAVILHELPLGASAAAGIYCATGRRGKTMLIALLTAMAQPVGALTAWLFLGPYLSGAVLGGVYALMAGIVAYTAMFELLPTAMGIGERRAAPWICAGMCFLALLGAL